MAMDEADDCTILIAEDSEADVRVIRRALKKVGLEHQIHHVSNGRAALDFLRGRDGGETGPATVILLLDLNMPGMTGKEVLREIKEDDALKTVPVLVFSTSDDDRDVRACYALGANGYIKKPHDLDGFVEAMQAMAGFWLGTAVLPR